MGEIGSQTPSHLPAGSRLSRHRLNPDRRLNENIAFLLMEVK